jgi:hypothetical protein
MHFWQRDSYSSLENIYKQRQTDLGNGVVVLSFLTPWRENIQKPPGSGVGSGFFLPPASTMIQRPGDIEDIIFMKRLYSVRLRLA